MMGEIKPPPKCPWTVEFDLRLSVGKPPSNVLLETNLPQALLARLHREGKATKDEDLHEPSSWRSALAWVPS